MKRPPKTGKSGSRRRSPKRRTYRPDPRLGLVAVPQAAGKRVEELTLANSQDDNGIDILFDDQSGLSFSFETTLKMRVSQAAAGSDRWREIRRWSRVRPE